MSSTSNVLRLVRTCTSSRSRSVGITNINTASCRKLSIVKSMDGENRTVSTSTAPLSFTDNSAQDSNANNVQKMIQAVNNPVGSDVSASTGTSRVSKDHYQRDFSTVTSSNISSFDSPTGSPSSSSSSSQSQSSTWSKTIQEMEEIVNQSGSDITMDQLKKLASQPCTPLSLGDMYKYASANVTSKNYVSQRVRNAQFLCREIPIRIAQRSVDLLTLPYGLNRTQHVQEIVHTYLKYLGAFQTFPSPTNEEEELAFTNLLHQMVLDRGSIPQAIARGVFALKDDRAEGLDVQRLQEMEKALYRFFNARTGLRLLTEHHILSCKQLAKDNIEFRKHQSCLEEVEVREDYYGCIQKNCDPTIEARRVANQVMAQCKKRYGITPEIEIIDCTPEHFANSDFTYVPHHLQYMLAELLKNSCRATVKRYMDGTVTEEDHINIHHRSEDIDKKELSMPSVRVVVAKGAEDVTIKIADKGGGVPRSVIDKMWSFAHSTLSNNAIQRKQNDTHFAIDEFVSSGRTEGFNIRGFGLPLARIYARYFGGELTLKSMEGYGVDAYLYLPVLGVQCENLPKRVLKSPGQGDSITDGNHFFYYGDTFSKVAL